MSLTLPPLSYPLDALEPYISRHTLAAHHDYHHAAYVQKARALTQCTPLESASLEDIVRAAAVQANALFKVAAQSWNHAFYWNCMRPGGGGDAHGAIGELIEACFGTHLAFKRQFVRAASEQCGCGWVWLVLDAGRLGILSTSDADTPLTTTAIPLLTLDVWEHAYYLDYQYRRLDYIAAFLGHLVNWDFVNETLAAAKYGTSRTPGAQEHENLAVSVSLERERTGAPSC